MIIILILLSLLSSAESIAKSQNYYSFPAKYLPIEPDIHPRIYLKNRLPQLKKLYYTTPELPAVAAFKHDLDKLLSYTTACQDWRCANGWPAAALALDWLITGNSASGKKACDVFLPHFEGTASHTQEANLYYALAYDWLFHHPCFTDERKADLRNKLIRWSNATAATDETPTWIAHDSDRNIATTAGHFISGLAILGEDRINGLKLLKRGWTGWKYGLNTHDLLADFPVSKFFRTSVETGIPLPGWDYGMMSDVHIAQNLFYILDELGVIDQEFSELKNWWANSLTYFMHSVDPANTHWRWIGDQQSSVELAQYTGYVWSYLSNCVFLAERFGAKTIAALGRSFLDQLRHPNYGIADGDTMLWFMTTWSNSAPRRDFKKYAPRYVLGGFGPKQNMGIGMFRSAWSSSNSFADNPQVIWGGFYGIGSYIVDHMHNSAGSFWLWRNGEYLLTEPVNYGGNEAAVYPFTLWNSLSIPNEAVPNNNESHDNGGPIVYFNQGSAYLERGRADEKQKIFYALLNADKNYNVPENIWAACTGTCRQPVKKYSRTFVYDGVSEIIFLVDKVDLARERPIGLRFRTPNPSVLSQLIDQNTVSVPSEQGNYQTVIQVLTPISSQPWNIAPEPWDSVPNWQIKQGSIGSQVHKDFASALSHRIVTVLNTNKKSSGSLKSSLISDAPQSLGGCAQAFCVITAEKNAILRSSVNYTTPENMPAQTRHLITDLEENNCYIVMSSISGKILSGAHINSRDNSLLFTVPESGAQRISLNTTNCTNN